MAQVDFNQFNKKPSTQATKQNGDTVGFFKLTNDGDEAIVRFLQDTPESFDMVTYHDVEVDGRIRKVNCLREGDEPLDKCPLCAGGTPLKSAIFIRLIEYVKQPDGTFKGEAKVWERPATYANRLAVLINNYGPLSESLFKVVRHGNYVPSLGRKNKITYDINYAPEKVYPNELYPSDAKSLFENYHAVGRLVLNKTADELSGNAPVEEASVAAPIGTGVQVNTDPVQTEVQRPKRYY